MSAAALETPAITTSEENIEELVQKLSALNTSFKNQNLTITNEGLEKLNGISIAPPITAWTWTKSISK